VEREVLGGGEGLNVVGVGNGACDILTVVGLAALTSRSTSSATKSSRRTSATYMHDHCDIATAMHLRCIHDKDGCLNMRGDVRGH